MVCIRRDGSKDADWGIRLPDPSANAAGRCLRRSGAGHRGDFVLGLVEANESSRSRCSLTPRTDDAA
jgi:hypothetical protein